jgi:SAM-dependent methyltransferase
MRASAPTAPPVGSGIPPTRRFLRRIKSVFFSSNTLYGISLRCKYGQAQPAPPQAALPNGVLQSSAQWLEATTSGKQLHLPLHRADEKNWDHLAAVHAIAGAFPKTARVLDAGAEFYSNVLPALFAYGYRNLYGMNLSFTDPARRGSIRYLPGDITRTGFPDAFFDAITCMSVIEHGVPLEAYFCEMYRLLKPGGLLITSTDYYPEPIDTSEKIAHEAPIKIFSRQDAQAIIAQAQECGLQPTGAIDLECSAPTVRWDLYDLDYTFLIFTLRKP